jgi:hypothetical protein
VRPYGRPQLERSVSHNLLPKGRTSHHSMLTRKTASGNESNSNILFDTCNACSVALKAQLLKNGLCKGCHAAHAHSQSRRSHARSEKLKSARERTKRVSVTRLSGSIDYNTRPPSGTNLSIIPTPGVLDTAVTSGDNQILLQVNPQVPTAMGNPAGTALGMDRTSAMCTTGEIGVKPTSPQARVLPVLYVPGTHRRGGFSATR